MDSHQVIFPCTYIFLLLDYIFSTVAIKDHFLAGLGPPKKNLELGNSSALPKVVSVLIIVSVSI